MHSLYINVLVSDTNSEIIEKLINLATLPFLKMRSQISIEFMTGVAVMLFIYVTTIGIYSSYAQTNMIENEVAQEICYRVSTGVSSAVIGGNGFAINISLPYRIQTNNYNAVIISNQSLVTVDWKNGLFACSIISQNVTGKWVYPGKFSANNINAIVYITSITTDDLTYAPGETVKISGGYFLNNTIVNVVNEQGIPMSGYPKLVLTTNHEFNDTWIAGAPGLYTVSGTDTAKKSLYGERIIEVI